MHFDDDDYYSDNYCNFLVTKLNNENLDFINLRGWFLLDHRNKFFGYWNLTEKKGIHFVCERGGINIINVKEEGFLENNETGWGFGFVYRNKVAKDIKYSDVNWREDGEFSRKVSKKYKSGAFYDTDAIFIHEIHGANSSRGFPQYRIPYNWLKNLFPDYVKI